MQLNQSRKKKKISTCKYLNKSEQFSTGLVLYQILLKQTKRCFTRLSINKYNEETVSAM